MGDAELEAIRARRMAELQAQQGGGAAAAAQQQEERRRAMEEQRKHILSQILTNDARERLSRVALVKPERARQVEDLIIRMAQTGQIRSEIDEDRVKELLEQFNEKQKKETKITIKRRAFDDDDY
eukprot:GEZU01001072.1.p1 GENE.GEZU01001072.1~~GEZU01001072.1.p1  ORF type:complete len:144 (-),score=37.61 GEZU01001072.1:21-395(-)